MDQLSAELSKAKAAAEAHKTKCEEMHKMLEKALSQASSQKEDMAMVNAEAESLRIELTSVRVEAQTLRDNLDSAGRECDRLRIDQDGHLKEIEALKGEGGGLQERLDRSEADLEEARRLKNAAEEAMRARDKEVSDMTGRMKGAEHANQKLEEKIEHLQDQVEFWDAEGKKLMSEADAAKHRVVELEEVRSQSERNARGHVCSIRYKTGQNTGGCVQKSWFLQSAPLPFHSQVV